VLGLRRWLPHPRVLSVEAIPVISYAVSIEKFVRVGI
jgi:hypothetical protein